MREGGRQPRLWERERIQHTQTAKDVAGSGSGCGSGAGGGGFHIIHYGCPLQRAVATAPSEGGPTAMAMATRFSWCVPRVFVCAGISFV